MQIPLAQLEEKGVFMQQTPLQAIILAAGRSKRFNTHTSKLLEKICGQEMILYPVKLLAHMHYALHIVVGYQADAIKNIIKQNIPKTVNFVEQTEQRGTGHALLQTQPFWQADHILIINGDCPLINQALLEELVTKHVSTKSVITFVTAHHTDPHHQYGRVVKQDGITKIIEKSDYQINQDQCCINAGIYIFDKKFLHKHSHDLKPNSQSQEIYLTDLIAIAAQNHYKVETIDAPYDTIRGVNTLKELWAVEQIKRCELISSYMDQGIIFSFPQSTHIEVTTRIGSGTRIGAGVHLIDNTSIGQNCHIGPFSLLENVTLGNNVIIESHTVLKDCIIEDGAHIGPFARIRNESKIQENAQIGNFVEVSKSVIGTHTKAKHLSYLGNAHIGNEVNIGAGTITCNYDGFEKHTTTIADGAFIGSHNTLIAPLTIEKKSYTAAGSTITHNVPSQALAIGRARQINKENYVVQLKKKRREKKEKKIEKNIVFIGAKKTINDSSL